MEWMARDDRKNYDFPDPSVGNGAVEFVVFGFAIGPAEQGAKYAESR